MSMIKITLHYITKTDTSYNINMLDIGESLIPCVWIGFVHVQNVHDHHVDDHCLTINLGVEASGFGEIGVQQ